MSNRHRTLVSAAILVCSRAMAQEPIITSFQDGYLSWTNVNPALYYTVEYRPNLSETSPSWDGSHRVSQDVKSTNAIITVPVGFFYRVVGSMDPMQTPTLSATTTVVNAGYYAATNLAQVDTDLAAGNIATNVTIFGVAGTLSAAGGSTYTRIIRLSGALGFGNCVTGLTKTAVLTLGNDGDCAMTVAGIQYPDSFSGNWSGKVLAGGSTNVTVTFAPALVQAYSGTITVNGDPTSGTNTIACSGTGGVPGRYVDNGNGTVTDQETGLMWTKNANPGGMLWADAVAYCSNLVYAGYDDWRLPSVNQNGDKAELDTLGRPGGIPGATPFTKPGAPFTDVQNSYYWSGTSASSDAWIVYMSNGLVKSWYKDSMCCVWPVRGGQ